MIPKNIDLNQKPKTAFVLLLLKSGRRHLAAPPPRGGRGRGVGAAPARGPGFNPLLHFGRFLMPSAAIAFRVLSRSRLVAHDGKRL
jgi:hypothetical protein